MDYVLHLFYLLAGFFCLIKGADLFIQSAGSIARKFRISPVVIGLTLVAFGTSLPELAVSFVSAIVARNAGQTADLAMGNVIGSNLANLLLILGASAVLMPIIVKRTIKIREFPFLLLITSLLAVFACFFQNEYQIVWWEALILVAFFIFYLGLMFRNKEEYKPDDMPQLASKQAIVFLLVGILGVALGGYLVTSGAEFLATRILVELFSVAKAKATMLVGLSVVALGTSLPELVTTITAAKKGESDIALGNIVGSNIFNILLIVGLSGLVTPLGLDQSVLVDLFILIGISILVFVLAILKSTISRRDGVLFLVFYACYLAYVIVRALGYL